MVSYEPQHTNKSDVRDLVNITDEDVLSDSQITIAIRAAERTISDDIPDQSAEDKEEASLLLAGHFVRAIMRGGTAVIEDGDMKLENTQQTIYKAMYEEKVESGKSARFGRAGNFG